MCHLSKNLCGRQTIFRTTLKYIVHTLGIFTSRRRHRSQNNRINVTQYTHHRVVSVVFTDKRKQASSAHNNRAVESSATRFFHNIKDSLVGCGGQLCWQAPADDVRHNRRRQPPISVAFRLFLSQYETTHTQPLTHIHARVRHNSIAYITGSVVFVVD